MINLLDNLFTGGGRIVINKGVQNYMKFESTKVIPLFQARKLTLIKINC